MAAQPTGRTLEAHCRLGVQRCLSIFNFKLVFSPGGEGAEGLGECRRVGQGWEGGRVWCRRGVRVCVCV